jgi:paraquat-inducible protein A
MTTTLLGSGSSDTILSGVAVFWSHGDYPIALIIFIASIVIPLAKLFSLSWLCFSVMSNRKLRPRQVTRLFRMTEFIGRWSMVDVFVVAILVALVQLGNIMTIQPGPAAIAFAMVVIVTMFAVMSFDPRLIWDALGNELNNEKSEPVKELENTK